ncbi:bifunctional GNAT family N-acetyltransferase/acetate--CoA ligase family protein [Streptomyces sp. CNQ085]|uniref:bifunctional acetate--CoA ligase family protein/GNAT family N-acetyltransferase n=1 Tax=Streptomyces sp. CNQ085 TaxID=2886944 RepID=UPI001F5049F2|nr:bifunctional GNAT family N-acetyltransferase/acetate--CoA ligase family protein [Streptomyces sp. CNQ085]MCI0382938.1 GNAT family N-acetyltransferase [Streptomyces sp. CNQ085]
MRTPSEPAYPAHWEADVVLRDGGTARVRPITAEDAERLVRFYEQVSDQSKYYRFFAPYPRLSDRDVRRFTHHDYVDRVGLAAIVGGEFIATVRYDRIDATGRPASPPADEAEVAFLVRDDHQGRGVGSALLEHIAACARERGVRRFVAEVLPANTKMVKVFTDAGYSQKRSFEDGTVHLTFGITPTEQSLAVMRAREQRAEGRSVQRLLSPGVVAVIGASRSPGGAGRTVLESLRAAGFTGRVHAVNRALEEGRAEIDSVPAHRSVRDIPEPVDLAVVAVPAREVPGVVDECGRRGVQGLVVLSADFGRDAQRELVRRARSYGMRIIGPNALGLINTAPDVRLNATLSPETPERGRVGLFTQSGAIGIAVLAGLHRRGRGVGGVSTFVSAGNRADVSGNDVLQYWDDDTDTDVVLMYLESFGNPRKFNRLARRTAARKPIVVVKGARHNASAPPPGHAVPAGRTPDATVSSLLRQAGVIRVDTVTELVDAGVLLATQPLPAGPRVGILGNAESLCLLTYDTCLARGLRPQPVTDLTTEATPGDFGRTLAAALADPATDAVVVTAIPWVDGSHGAGDAALLAESLARALRESAGTADAGGDDAGGDGDGDGSPDTAGAANAPAKPVVVVHLAIEGLDAALAEHRLPAYPAPERAVGALSEAVRYAQWRRESAEPGRVPEYDDIDEAAAAALLTRVREPDRGTLRSTPLSGEETAGLLGHYGVSVQPVLPAPAARAARVAAKRLGYPVALKTTAPHLRHRPDLGGVRLDIGSEAGLRRAYARMTEQLGEPAELRPVIQAMAPRGVDTVVKATVDPAIGAVLSFGLAGPPSELLGDVAHRLVPVTDRDAAELVRSIRSAPVLFGWRGAQPVDTGALEELLLRVSRLVEDHPEVVSVDLEPVVVAARGLTVLDAAVRVAEPPAPSGTAHPAWADLGPRRLPAY